MSIENLNPTFGKNLLKKKKKTKNFSKDPWEDTEKETGIDNSSIIHIRTQARNGRKKITTVQGLPKNTAFKLLLKEWKKVFHCNGSIEVDEEFGKVIRLSGDNRKAIAEFLIAEEIGTKETIKMHGG